MAAGEKVRVVLRWIQILDRKEPFFKKRGEFVFRSRIFSEDGGPVAEQRLPAEGVFEISDDPSENRLRLDVPLFEGLVADHLAIELTGEEQDVTSANDELNPYRRIFRGPPATWLGSYGPGDERIEPEDLGDWRIWYRIERAE